MDTYFPSELCIIFPSPAVSRDLPNSPDFPEQIFVAKVIDCVDKALPAVNRIQRICDMLETSKPSLSRQLTKRINKLISKLDDRVKHLFIELDDARDRANRASTAAYKFDWAEAAETVTPTERINVRDAPPKPAELRELFNHKFRRYFLRAMQLEIESLLKHEIWEVEKRPENERVIKSKWVFDYKIDPFGFIERFKARLVAVGCSQQPGVHFEETHSPVVKTKVIRIALALSAILGLNLRTADVVTAYLYGNLDIPNHMEMPPGFEQYDENGEKLVCKLRKSLYGLHQSGRCWNRKFKSNVESLGFRQLKSEPCAFIKFDAQSKTFVLLFVYVDDVIIASTSVEMTAKYKELIKTKFDLRENTDEASWILKIRIERFQHGIWIGQTQYIEKILRQHGLWDIDDDSKIFRTPMSTTWARDELAPRLTKEQAQIYVSMIAQCLYLATTSRPDILFAVNSLSQFQQNPTTNELNAAYRILGYLRYTRDFGLFYRYGPEHEANIIIFESDAECPRFTTKIEPEGWTDASYGQEADRKSRGAYLFTLNGCLVAWYSKRQGHTSLSSTEAEIGGLVEGIKESLWMRDFLNEIGANIDSPIKMNQDNKSVIALAINPIHHARVKHMEIKMHFIHENVENAHVKLVWCPTDLMLADILTKALPAEQHWQLLKLIGMHSLANIETDDISNRAVRMKHS